MIIEKFKIKHKICTYKENKPENPLKKKRKEGKTVAAKINVKASWSPKKNNIVVDYSLLLTLHGVVRLILLAHKGILKTDFVLTSEYRGTVGIAYSVIKFFKYCSSFSDYLV